MQKFLAHITACLFCIFVMALAQPAKAIEIDLSERQIDIRYSFNGADLILFGAVGATDLDLDGPSFDIVIVVRGPEDRAVVRQKTKIGGLIWVNGDHMTFEDVPGYYAVAANRPLSEIASRVAYAESGIGFENLALNIDPMHKDGLDAGSFRQALYRLRSGQDLFRQEKDSVTIMGEGLFRTDVRLPASVPVGDFLVDAFVFQSGNLLAKDQINLVVDKAGFERAVFNFAHGWPFLYGLTAVFIALFSGWVAGMAGKK